MNDSENVSSALIVVSRSGHLTLWSLPYEKNDTIMVNHRSQEFTIKQAGVYLFKCVLYGVNFMQEGWSFKKDGLLTLSITVMQFACGKLR